MSNPNKDGGQYGGFARWQYHYTPGVAISDCGKSGGSSAQQAIQPLAAVEKQVILAALKKAGGNKTEAARHLGITRKTLMAKLSR